MRALCSPVSLFLALLSLLLLPVLAAAPSPPTSRSAKGIDARDAVSWLKAQRTEDVRPKFEVRLATSSEPPRTDVALRDAPEPAATAVESREKEVRLQGSNSDESHQISPIVERKTVSVAPRAGQDVDIPQLVLRSAAPKVFGVNIFLIIAWLVFMYLVYRTGSI